MISWESIFGETSIDDYISPANYSGLPFLEIEKIIDELITNGWSEWIDRLSGTKSAIGLNVRIWQGASIRKSILSDNVVIGHCSEVIESIVLDRAKVNHLSAIGRSIIGPDVNITSHVVIASNRLDFCKISLPFECFGKEEYYLPKFGAIIGKGVIVGSHSLINPGSIILPNTTINPFSSWP